MQLRPRVRLDPEPERVGLENIDPAHFDVVIVDEFHHAAAPSYRALLERVSPVELLGLTATPERSDGLPVLDWFDNRIAAELRLWDAIDQHRLVAVRLLRHPRRPRPARDPLASAGEATTSRGSRTSSRRPTPGRGRSSPSWAAHVDDVSAHARARVLRQRRARALHGARLQRSRASAPRRLGRQSRRGAPCGPRRPRGATRQRGVLGRPLQRGRRRAGGRHAPAAASDRQPDPVPAAAGPRPAPQPSARPSARCSTSSAATAPSSGSTAASAPCSAAAARTSPEQIERGSPFCRRAATWSSTASRRTSSCRTSATPCRRAGPPRSRSSGSSRPRRGHHAGRLSRSDRPGARGRLRRQRSPGRDLRSDAGLRVAARRARTKRSLRRACGRLLHVDDAARIEAYRRLLLAAEAPAAESLSVRDRRLLRMLVASRGRAARSEGRRASNEGCGRPVGAPAGSRRAPRAPRRARDRDSSTFTRSFRLTPTCRCRCTRATRASRSWRRSASGEAAPMCAPWQTGV